MPPKATAPAPAAPPKPAPGQPGGAGEPTGMFTPPPPGAPQETTQPLDPGLVAEQRAKAAQNEKELAPLKFALDKAVASAAAAPGGVQTAPFQAPPDAPAGSTAQSLAAPVAPAPVPAPTPAASAQPAASNTDTPSRGIPKPIADPGKQITGGFGHSGGFEAQYYALDGTELRAVVKKMIAQLEIELDKDLRFGIAICYPQVAARVTIEIGGANASATVNDVAFTVESRIAMVSATEMDDNSTPADQLRVDAGLERPYKRVVQTPTGNFIVDRETSIEPEPAAPSGTIVGVVPAALADPNAVEPQ